MHPIGACHMKLRGARADEVGTIGASSRVLAARGHIAIDSRRLWVCGVRVRCGLRSVVDVVTSFANDRTFAILHILRDSGRRVS